MLCLESGIVSPLRLCWVKDGCVFMCNLPPALLAEWPGHFMCHCSNTGMEWTPNMSQHTKLTLEKKILRPLLPGFEPTTFRSEVWCFANKLSWLVCRHVPTQEQISTGQPCVKGVNNVDSVYVYVCRRVQTHQRVSSGWPCCQDPGVRCGKWWKVLAGGQLLELRLGRCWSVPYLV